MRCRPSILMSPTVNSPDSVCASTAGTARKADRAATYFNRIFRVGSAEQPGQVVVESETHEHEQQQDADLLANGLCAFGERTALHEFGDLVDHLPAVEDRNGQQIQHEQTHTHDRQEGKERQYALSRGKT